MDVDSGSDTCDAVDERDACRDADVPRVSNSGSKVTEFYLLAEDGLRIVGEVENVGPGLTRDLVVDAPEGSYVTACKPGMKGKGIRGGFTVTPSDEDVAPVGDEAALVAKANANYAAYVKDQSAQLLEETERVRRALQGRRGRRGARSVPRCTHALGAHRDGRRVVR